MHPLHPLRPGNEGAVTIHRAVSLQTLIVHSSAPNVESRGDRHHRGFLFQESVGLRVNLLQIRLDGPYFAAFLVNRTTIALQNQQNLSSPSRIFASIS
jgi:hypothetical protein